jgi:hypothetical protein
MTDQGPRRDFGAWKAHLDQTFLKPVGERTSPGGRGVHHLALICCDV